MSSTDRQRGETHVTAILGAIASLVTILAFLGFQFDVFGADERKGRPSQPAGRPTTVASLSLTKGQGPSGTVVTVTGRGFGPEEPVELSFHTEDLTPARTDAAGGFRVDVRIPGTFDPFAGQQFRIEAFGKVSFQRATVPFLLTER